MTSESKRILGRIVVLVFLILIIVGGGVLWFDYLNVIDAKNVIGPVIDFLRVVPFVNRILPPGDGRTQPYFADEGYLSLDAERFAVRIEALELRNMELEKQEFEIQSRWEIGRAHV